MTPTQADIERVRAAYEEFNARFEQIKTGDLTGFEDYCAPDLVMVSVDGWPVAGRFEGLDGYRRWVREVYGGTEWNRFEEQAFSLSDEDAKEAVQRIVDDRKDHVARLLKLLQKLDVKQREKIEHA